jgi:hypothetical protein
MKPEDKELAEQVIEFFKKSEKSKLSPFRDLAHIITDRNKAEKLLYPLELDFGLLERSGSSSFRLTQKGWDFTGFADLEKAGQEEKDFRQIEIALAKSNIEANKLNAKVAKRNMWAFIINILFGAINISILIWQILKSG